jgi:hypothetical protein
VSSFRTSISFSNAERRFLERDLHVVAQIGAALPPLAINLRATTKERLENSRTAAHSAAASTSEDFAENIEGIVETSTRGTSGALRKGGMAIAIVSRALVRIHEHVVRFAELLEALFRARIARVLIGVEFDGELPVRTLDLLFRRLAGDGEDLVVVALFFVGI